MMMSSGRRPFVLGLAALAVAAAALQLVDVFQYSQQVAVGFTDGNHGLDDQSERVSVRADDHGDRQEHQPGA